MSDSNTPAPGDALAFAVDLLATDPRSDALHYPLRGLLRPTSVSPEGIIETAVFTAREGGDPVEVTLPEFIVVHRTRAREERKPHLDPDTWQKSAEGPFEDWESDFTGLIHVLWSARHQGITIQGEADTVARMILRSRWFAAARDAAVQVDAREKAVQS